MDNNKLFVYGILKRGYELDLEGYGAKFISEAYIPGAILYGIGNRWAHEGHPHDGRQWSGVGLALNVGPSSGVAHGELWEIPSNLWGWLDSIEQNGYCYTRKIVPVHYEIDNGQGEDVLVVNAWVYEYTYPGFNYANPIEGGRF